MKKKTLLLMIFVFSAFIFADKINATTEIIVTSKYDPDPGNICTYGTCLKKIETTNYPVIYCAEENKGWSNGNNGFICEENIYSDTDEYVYAYIYNWKFTQTFSEKEQYVIKQFAIWSYINDKKSSVLNTKNHDDQIKDKKMKNEIKKIMTGVLEVQKAAKNEVLTLTQGKSDEENNVLKYTFQIKTQKLLLANTTATVTLTNTDGSNIKNICSNIKINKKDFKYENGQCSTTIDVSTKNVNITLDSSKISSDKINLNVKVSVNTYKDSVSKCSEKNCNRKTGTGCHYEYYSNGNKKKLLQTLIKYDKPTIKSSSINITLEKSKKCISNCCKGYSADDGLEYCCEKDCPKNKCPASDDKKETIGCNDGVTMTSECESLSTKENSEDNVISIKEEGTFSNALSTNEVIAGGSIKFNLIYHNTVTWECKSSTCDGKEIDDAANEKIEKIEDFQSKLQNNSNNKINNSQISNVNCYRNIDNNNNKIETTCIIEYTKEISTDESKESISMSAKIEDLNVLNDSSSDTEDNTTWTGKWSVTVNGSDTSCKVSIKKGKYSNYRYRPIDLNNPFPKNVIGINWLNWVNNNTKNNENYAFTTTIDKINNGEYDYQIEITKEVDKKIEEYNKKHSNSKNHNVNEFFDEFGDLITVGGSK